MINTIVTAKWLNDNLDNPNLVILDASLEAKADGTKALDSNITIANARFFDLKNVFKDKSNNLPNTVPTSEYFENECQKLGINSNSQIVVFDNFGVFSSPRVWWLFNLMGHKNITVLDGGLPDWIKQGFDVVEKSKPCLQRPLQQKRQTYELGNFKTNFKHDLLITFDEVVKNIQTKAFTIVDARSNGRFNGTANEPREHLNSGHIDNSVNIPYQSVLENGKFKDKPKLNTVFKSLCDLNDDLVFSCGSGMTACIIMLACEIGFKESKKVYDGSWTEWAELKSLRNDI